MGQDKPRTIVEGELTSRRVFCPGRPQADWELRKPNVRSSRFALCCLPALEPNSVEATILGNKEVTQILSSRSIGWREDDTRARKSRGVETIGRHGRFDGAPSVPSFRGRLTSARRFQRKFN